MWWFNICTFITHLLLTPSSQVLPCTLNANQCHILQKQHASLARNWSHAQIQDFSPQLHNLSPLSNPILIHPLLVEYFFYIRATSIRIKPISTLSLQRANWICSRLLINSRADWHVVRSFAYRDLLTSPSACLRAWHRAKSQSGNWLWREEAGERGRRRWGGCQQRGDNFRYVCKWMQKKPLIYAWSDR